MKLYHYVHGSQPTEVVILVADHMEGDLEYNIPNVEMEPCHTCDGEIDLTEITAWPTCLPTGIDLIAYAE